MIALSGRRSSATSRTLSEDGLKQHDLERLAAHMKDKDFPVEFTSSRRGVSLAVRCLYEAHIPLSRGGRGLLEGSRS